KNAVSFPKPSQPIPIWIGGNSDAAVRRAARTGDGWHSIAIPPAAVRHGRETIQKGGRKVTISMRSMVSVTAEGTRSESGISGTRAQVLRQLEEYKDAGVEYFLLQSGAGDAGSV